jgi:hypothetical protein
MSLAPAFNRARRYLALGFYDRGNLGDEMFVEVFARNLTGDITFVCSDDCKSIPPGTDAIIVGGGDIVKPHFMDTVRRRIRDARFCGPMYLLSVGIPYTDATTLAYLRDYDHVFVRSAADYRLACSVLPPHDVTLFRDAAWSLPRTPRIAPTTPPAAAPRVAVTLAQPYFYNNPNAEALKDAVQQLVTRLAQRSSVVYLVAFNTHAAAQHECDIYINDEIAQTARTAIKLRVQE